jgi:hypothetical protein
LQVCCKSVATDSLTNVTLSRVAEPWTVSAGRIAVTGRPSGS